MRTKFVEATQAKDGGINWGKFMVGMFDEEEWRRTSLSVFQIAQRSAFMSDSLRRPVLAARGWNPTDVIVFDLETCEGAAFSPGGMPKADLDKHKVWVCPMFEPFLEWLYAWIKTDGWPDEAEGKTVYPTYWFDALPALVELPDAPAAAQGYRREGVHTP